MKRESVRTGYDWLLGVVAGFINGLLGSGGGVVLLLGMTWLRAGEEDKDRFAGTALVMLILSSMSAAVYFGTGRVTASQAAGYLPSAALGGAIGAYCLDRIPTAWLNRLFALLVLVAGGMMLLR